jgi:transglutaminase-like putative cysteine protease
MKQNWIKNGGNVVWVAAWIVLSLHLTSTAGVVASASGALLGLFLPEFLSRRRVRDWVIAAGAGLFWLCTGLLSVMFRESTFIFSMMGAEGGYTFLEMMMWGGTALGLTALLQTARRRVPALIVIQVLFAGGTLAAILAAHRDGAQHRPYFLVDPMLLRGKDPVIVLLLAGVVVAVAILMWLFCQTSGRRRLRDLTVLLALIALGILFLPESATRFILHQAGGGGSSDSKKNDKGRKKQANGDKGGSQGKAQDPDPNGGSDGKPQPVAVVTFHDDYDPPEKYFYFRQTALSSYRDDRLVADTSKKYDADIMNGFPTNETPVPHLETKLAQRVHTTVTLIAPHSRPFGLVTAADFGPAPNPNPARFDRAYSVDSLGMTKSLRDLIQMQPGTPPGGDAVIQYRKGPDDPRFAAILNEAVTNYLRPDLRDLPLFRAAAVKLWMDDHIIYNLKAKHDTTNDPVADFLFGDRNGYCVHIAQASALLYRLAGVPSRVGEGYLVEARRRGHGSTLMIRDRDAHAWPEIYIDGVGWIVLDISPKHTVSPPPPPPDPEQQKMLGQMVRPLNPPKKEEQPKSGPDFDIRGAILTWLLRAILAVLILLYLGKLWRRISVRVCRPASVSRVAFRAALDRLAEVSLVRRTAQTREQFCLELAPKVPSLRPLTEIHIEDAFGEKPQVRPRTQYLQLLRNVSKEIWRTRPGWRVALGFLDPVSWTRVR